MQGAKGAAGNNLNIDGAFFLNDRTSGGDGGAIDEYYGHIHGVGATFAGDAAVGEGGAIHEHGSVDDLASDLFMNDTGHYGGAIFKARLGDGGRGGASSLHRLILVSSDAPSCVVPFFLSQYNKTASTINVTGDVFANDKASTGVRTPRGAAAASAC